MLTAMRTAMAALLLAVVSSSAMADWVELGSTPNGTLYAEPAIRMDGDRPKLWALNDFKTPQAFYEGTTFLSQKMQYEYDCMKSQYRLVYFSAYSGSMAEGEVVDFNIVPGEWQSIPPETGVEVTWKFACRKA